MVCGIHLMCTRKCWFFMIGIICGYKGLCHPLESDIWLQELLEAVSCDDVSSFAFSGRTKCQDG